MSTAGQPVGKPLGVLPEGSLQHHSRAPQAKRSPPKPPAGPRGLQTWGPWGAPAWSWALRCWGKDLQLKGGQRGRTWRQCCPDTQQRPEPEPPWAGLTAPKLKGLRAGERAWTWSHCRYAGCTQDASPRPRWLRIRGDNWSRGWHPKASPTNSHLWCCPIKSQWERSCPSGALSRRKRKQRSLSSSTWIKSTTCWVPEAHQRGCPVRGHSLQFCPVSPKQKNAPSSGPAKWNCSPGAAPMTWWSCMKLQSVPVLPHSRSLEKLSVIFWRLQTNHQEGRRLSSLCPGSPWEKMKHLWNRDEQIIHYRMVVFSVKQLNCSI